MNSIKSFIGTLDKKDYKYWILILTFLLILSWTIRVNSTTELLDKISFAVGLSSLLLSVIAIFYSIVKGEQTTQQAVIVQESLQKIRESVEDIKTIKQELKDTRHSMESSFTNVLERFYKFEDALMNSENADKKTSESMDSFKSAIFSEAVKEKREDITYYYDARFERINDYFPDSMVHKMLKSSAKELGLKVQASYTGSNNLIYAAFSGPKNFNFEKEILNNDPDLHRTLKLVKVDEIQVI